MAFGFVLLEAQQLVGIIDVFISQILDIAETESAVEAEDERPTDFVVLQRMMIGEELGYFIFRKDILAKDLVIDLDGDACAGIFADDIVLNGIVDDFLETLEATLGTFAHATSLKIFGESRHHIFG